MKRALLIGLLAVGCADFGASGTDGGNVDGNGSGGSGGTGGTGGSGGGVDGGGDGPPPRCTVAITETSMDPYVAPTLVTFLAAVTGDTALQYAWSVTPQDSTTTISSSAERATLRASAAGSYFVTVHVTTSRGGCDATHGPITILAPGSTVARIRITPPTSDVPRREWRKLVSELGPGGFYAFGAGINAVIQPIGANQPIASYLRLTDPTSCLTTEAYTSGTPGASMSVLPVDYRLLIIPVPDHPDLAPTLAQVLGIDLGAGTNHPEIHAGIAVAGQVFLSNGTPFAGARVELRSATLPSSIGTAASDGSVQVRLDDAATADITVVPPDGVALPVAQSSGLPILVADPMPLVTFTYDAIPTAQLSGVVSLPDGSGASGARVYLATRPMARVGQLVIGSTAPLPIGGTFQREISAGTGGVVAATTLPAAVYDVLIEPPAGVPNTARTRMTIDLTQGDRLALPLNLTAPVNLTGHIRAADGTAVGGDVRVVERGASMVVVHPDTAQNGFGFGVDPSATYDIIATPSDTYAPVRAQLTVGVGDASIDLTVPHGRMVSGMVTGPTGAPMNGALVEIFFGSCAADEQPVASGVTSNGQFLLLIPDGTQ
jgi:hypothetical protein